MTEHIRVFRVRPNDAINLDSEKRRAFVAPLFPADVESGVIRQRHTASRDIKQSANPDPIVELGYKQIRPRANITNTARSAGGAQIRTASPEDVPYFLWLRTQNQ